MRCMGLLIIVAACGGAQTPERGAAFCDSYESNYLGACRQDCDATVETGDSAGVERCKTECLADLKADDTFRDSCRDRADQL
jgi:hypothetical protein